MKVAVVGSSHGGFETVRGVLHDFPNAEIDWYEKGDFVSFLSCGIELYLQNVVKDVNSVSYATIDGMEAKGVHVHINSEVASINPAEHSIKVVDVNNGQTTESKYDKLVLSVGAVPFELPVPGKELGNIYAMRGRDWAILLKQAEVNPDIKNVTVIGSGYIGIEAAESFAKAGKKVTIIDQNPTILGTYLDPEFTDILTTELVDNGLSVKNDQSVKEFIGNDKGMVSGVITTTGETIPTDLVIEAAGIRPATEWLKDTVKLDNHGLIVTDEYQETSQPDIFAVGDATEIEFAPTGTKKLIALAPNARKQGRSAAYNLMEKRRKTTAVSGSSALHVYSYKFASTGLKDVTAKQMNLDVASVYITDTKVPPFVPAEDNAKVYFKLTYDPRTREVMGAQIMSKMDVTANINAISLAIQQHMTIDDLAYADFFFQPGFDRPWSVMNIAAQKAQDQLAK
ncbi:FAD-dependent oxidoreductase [Fructilactobacillus sp. Tb1]|uniref:FAD-dependent oxidoreductase n=1 Tax=Fructilactobacillus sp. Tb1 TaxID=3422304 RepID=UPI003D29DF28